MLGTHCSVVVCVRYSLLSSSVWEVPHPQVSILGKPASLVGLTVDTDSGISPIPSFPPSGSPNTNTSPSATLDNGGSVRTLEGIMNVCLSEVLISTV